MAEILGLVQGGITTLTRSLTSLSAFERRRMSPLIGPPRWLVGLLDRIAGPDRNDGLSNPATDFPATIDGLPTPPTPRPDEEHGQHRFARALDSPAEDKGPRSAGRTGPDATRRAAESRDYGPFSWASLRGPMPGTPSSSATESNGPCACR